MQAKQSPSNPSLSWGESLLARAPAPSLPSAQPPYPESRTQELRLDAQWRNWQKRLRLQLLLATFLYGAAHGVVGSQRLAIQAPLVTPGLGLGVCLFLVGTWLLWRVLRALNEPLAARYPNAARTAGHCLAVVMGLAFTPCIWLFLISK